MRSVNDKNILNDNDNSVIQLTLITRQQTVQRTNTCTCNENVLQVYIEYSKRNTYLLVISNTVISNTVIISNTNMQIDINK